EWLSCGSRPRRCTSSRLRPSFSPRVAAAPQALGHMMNSRQDATVMADADDTLRLRLEDFLPHRLNVLSSLVSQALTRVYGQYGIGIPEWRVLVKLGENRVRTGKAIRAPIHTHKNQVSRAVAHLQQRRSLRRRPNCP